MSMTAGKKLMRSGGAATMLGLVGMVTGAAMLAYSSVFGSGQQSNVALLIAAVGAAAAIAGVSLVCMGLVLRPRRDARRTTRRDRRYVPPVHRATYTRPARRASPVITGEQQVITG
ncbi:hypothetical protein [Agromyces cerinus]|uniref:Uncharacterized protein n=1 Tax=Agromyces cerinus subsp. cerinus TaxID=232089 RepID=A0A1N6HKF1_9MICO|nr:hypothetical protein [Agromyces cerinus]SIO20260.1 hypothetical protein SAMN05443544_3268 [Agromyces cerinus subsp. cerinus]